MKVCKSKTVTVELDADDLIEAVKLFAYREHPSLKKASNAEVGLFADGGVVETEICTAVATFRIEAKAEGDS